MILGVLHIILWVVTHFAASETDSGCPTDHFRIDSQCHRIIRCPDRDAITLHNELPLGYVKKLYLGEWKGVKVVYSVPRHNHTMEDFHHGIDMLRAFQSVTPYVVQMMGFCEHPSVEFLVTKFHKHGSADQLEELISTLGLTSSEELDVRFNLAEDYISILEFLHQSPRGVRVMCDSNDLYKTMSQFLITDNMRLVLLDADALPEVDRSQNRTIKCGHKELYGDFVAPEQLWPYEGAEFQDDEMPGYDEKTDIWKIPDVLHYLLGKSNAAYRLKLHLYETFRRCKEYEPELRPHASYVKDVFLRSVVHERRIKLEL